MKIYRKGVVGVVFVALLIVPTLCQAELYLGAYVGPNFARDVNPLFNFSWGAVYRTAKDVGVDPSFIVGGKIGFWFTKDSLSFLPDWMKYFGIELDVSYHPLNWPNQKVMISPINTQINMYNNGLALNTAFLFLFRYGFMPDSEVPFGRLQPYVGIGPLIFVAKSYLPIGQDFRSQEADLGLAVESGIRYMVRKNFSVNLGFRYRYVKAHIDIDDTILDQAKQYIKMYTRYDFFNIIFGAAYHF